MRNVLLFSVRFEQRPTQPIFGHTLTKAAAVSQFKNDSRLAYLVCIMALTTHNYNNTQDSRQIPQIFVFGSSGGASSF
jgi:uncharacterized alpha/beta hydrolase family protein